MGNEMFSLIQVFWYVAIPASVIFLVQSFLTFVGMDAHDGVTSDLGDMNDDGAFQLLSFRNLINFLLGFGWTGISFYSVIKSPAILVLVSVGVGALFIFGFFVLMQQISKLSQNNSFTIDKTLNRTGTVYLSIEGERKSIGKIQISIQGSFHELNAITNGPRLETGQPIRVVAIEDEGLVRVDAL